MSKGHVISINFYEFMIFLSIKLLMQKIHQITDQNYINSSDLVAIVHHLCTHKNRFLWIKVHFNLICTNLILSNITYIKKVPKMFLNSKCYHFIRRTHINIWGAHFFNKKSIVLWNNTHIQKYSENIFLNRFDNTNIFFNFKHVSKKFHL